MFVVNIVSRFMHSPSRHHLGAAKRILRDIQGTLNYGIRYTPRSKIKLISFTDSDWAGCANDRKSTTGYAFSLGSGVISWASKKQKSIVLSSTEAEYIAATSTACHAIWLRRILCDLKEKQDGPTLMICEYKSTIEMKKKIKIPVHQGRTKHIEIRHHFIRDQMEDIFTKPLADIFKWQTFSNSRNFAP